MFKVIFGRDALKEIPGNMIVEIMHGTFNRLFLDVSAPGNEVIKK